MNGTRIAGQILLWAGFISAALAAVRQQELDLLPDEERAVVQSLPEDLMLNKEELERVNPTPLDELPVADLESVISSVSLISSKNNADAEAEKEAAKKRKEAGEPEPEPTEEQIAKSKIKKVSIDDFVKSRTTNLENKWSTIPWLWYGLSMALGLIGVVLLRSTAKSAEQETGKVAEQYQTITSSIDKLVGNLTHIKDNLSKMSPQEVLTFIDDECGPPYADFADARNALIQRFGMQPFAEIMTQFASAERFTNRAWSASADGYMNEVKDCVDRAHAHLTEASKLIKSFDSNSAT